MVRSIIVAFDGKGLVLANATSRMPGMYVRVLIDGVENGRLETILELANAGPTTQPIVNGLATRYQVEIRPLESGPGRWRGHVTYLKVDQLRGHPAYDSLIAFVPRALGAVLFFEAGVGILRLDTDGAITPGKVEEALRVWAGTSRYCVESHADLPPIEAWRPGAECASVRRRLLEAP